MKELIKEFVIKHPIATVFCVSCVCDMVVRSVHYISGYRETDDIIKIVESAYKLQNDKEKEEAVDISESEDETEDDSEPTFDFEELKKKVWNVTSAPSTVTDVTSIPISLTDIPSSTCYEDKTNDPEAPDYD